jgi:hypothetical protein
MSNGKVKGKQLTEILLSPSETPLSIDTYTVSTGGTGKQLVNKEYVDSLTYSLQEITDVDNTTSKDIEITNDLSGLILRSPDGNRWRLTINNDGQLIAEQL